MLSKIIDDGSLIGLILNENNKLCKKTKNNCEHTQNAVTSGTCTVNGVKVFVVHLDKKYRMGTLGVFEGEKIALSFEYARKKRLPMIVVTASGGVRVEEGTLALMQMLKTIITVKKHSDKGLLYLAVVTNPTLGGVSASFVALADIIIAESNAIFGFTGRRIIEESTFEKLPDDFQTANFAKKHGMVDMVIDENKLKYTIGALLKLHKRD
jgi:acetyl-CoA carboxylase carboxyl transferase subunit beta